MIEEERLRLFIEEEISKKRAVTLVQQSPEPEALAAVLWKFILLNEHPLSWRATWFLEHLAAENKEYVRPYIDSIVEEFPSFKYDGQKRSSLKILLMFSLNDYHYEPMVGRCFDILLSHDEAMAVRMFCMRLLLQVVKKEPELKSELKESLEFILPHAQKGLLSACRKSLQALDRIK